MNTRYYFCEDCGEEVTVYGHLEVGTPCFIEVEREGHEDHDISGPIGG